MGIEEIVLDIDIFVGNPQRSEPCRRAAKNRYVLEHRTLTFTSVSVMEILAGLRHRSASVQIYQAEALFRDNREILPSADDYRLAGTIVGALYAQGNPIGLADPLIAACALNRDLPLATGNLRHFGYVADAGFPVRLEDWRQA